MLNDKNRFYGRTKNIDLDTLKDIFNSEKFAYVDIALLFGSRAVGNFHERSDYDFAIYAKKEKENPWGLFSKIWFEIGSCFKLNEIDYDVINLDEATDTMKKSIQKGYIILKGSEDDISRILG